MRVTAKYSEMQHILNSSAPFDVSPNFTGATTAVRYLLQNRTQIDNHSEEKPLLVDATEKFLSGRRSGTNRSSEHVLDSLENVTHRILWYNKPNWISTTGVNGCLKTCAYKNCETNTNITSIRQSSAVIFCTTTNGVGQTPPLNSTERPADQVWIFFAMESPVHLNNYYKQFRPTWINSLNWSMNYRLDSDIIIPYGYLTTRKTLPERNYTEIFKNKTKFAAWVVSNCHTMSLREKIVEQMKAHGLEIDVYGGCGQQLTADPLEMINKSYKFYLGFENSLCSDYITEKFFKYFNLNTVVIVRGGADYRKLLPSDTYINTADFNSFKGLVKYLKHIGSNETLYTGYLKRKDKYGTDTGMCQSFCALCRKLNNLDQNRRVYETVPTYSDTCHKPEDIDKWDHQGKTPV